MEKYIHYCWFGGKPLPKLAKKCLKSWQKYLPDYKIIEWNENNFDVNMTKFSKGAYEEKKWAFVSDVARIYALKNYGGIYFDTDMMLTKDVHFLEEDELFAGWESEFYVAVGVLGASHKENKLINELWDFYSNTEFDSEMMSSVSIPVLLTNLLKREYKLLPNHEVNQELKGGIKIYAKDYFYPISCDDSPNTFTDNTCMIHYYVASWVESSAKRRLKFQIKFGKKWGNWILDFLIGCKKVLKGILKVILYPLVLLRRKRWKNTLYEIKKKDFLEEVKNVKNNKNIVFYNKFWLGTKNAALELFENAVGIEEIEDERINDDIVSYISEKKIPLVIFSAFALGWDDLIIKIKENCPKVRIKIIWHGSNAMNSEEYDWECFRTIFDLLNKNILTSIAFVKKSMYEFYKEKGYNVEFLLNTVNLTNNYSQSKSSGLKIGLYASGDRWVKNFYNQLAAASMFKDAVIDTIPLTYKAMRMAKIFKANLSGSFNTLPREKVLERMAKNDINFYVTFSECAPLIPLESLELGVPCITSDNHHYWTGTELEKYLVVSKNDNIISIYEKAKYALENKETILKLYKEWKKDYDKKVKKNVEEFLK